MCRLPTLYNMAVQTLVEWKSFNTSYLDDLPGVIKEDVLRIALLRGKAQESVSCFLHPNLRDLRVNECKISCKDLENISHCREIRILEMNPPILKRFDHPTPLLKQLFSSLHRLVKLHVQRNDGITDDAVLALTTHCTMLQELDVSGCSKLTDRSGVSLSSLPYLRSINMSQTLISDEGLAALANGVCALSLTEITLNSCVKIRDKGFEMLLNNCKNLAILVCGGCPKISGEQAMQYIQAKEMRHQRLCCQLPPSNLGSCYHYGNCILKIHPSLLIVL